MANPQSEISRRAFLKAAGAGAIASALSSSLSCKKTSERKKLNQIIVTLDTTRKDHLTPYGYYRNTSPNLEGFAKDALIFEDCYSTSGITLPSHASIFTGLYPYNHGVLSNDERCLRPEIPAIGDWFQEQGYETGAVTSVSFLNKYSIGNGFKRIHNSPTLERTSEKTVKESLQMIDWMRIKDKPFFLWMHLWDPHFKYNPLPEFKGKFASKQKPVNLYKRLNNPNLSCEEEKIMINTSNLSSEEEKFIKARYDEEIAQMDSSIGIFLQELKQRGIYDNSVISFISDHGEALFNGPNKYTGHGQILESIVKVPLIIRHPDYHSKRIQGLIQNIDLAPTLLEMAEVPIPPHIDGKSALPSISTGKPVREEIYLTKSSGKTNSIITNESYKLYARKQRKTPLPSPEQWSKDLALPRIKFTSKLPEQWLHDSSKSPEYQWKDPASSQVTHYEVEITTSDAYNKSNTMALKVNPKKTRTGGKLKLPQLTRREWNNKALKTPHNMRIIGKNSRGQTISSSSIKQISYKSDCQTSSRLYDLTKDPQELINLSNVNPKKTRELELELEEFSTENETTLARGPKYLRDNNIPVFEGDHQTSQEDMEALRALGYLG
ncbi:MAG: sulfatase [Nanoarchaeota archaeon]|nr:sulfatase [Nanoarchaeota archaeon]